MTGDELKLARDGHLGFGPIPPSPPRPLFAVVERLPNGNVLTTDGGRGHIEWSRTDRTPVALHL